MQFKVDNTNYQVEFHHINKRAARHRAKMHYINGIYALTVCCVIVDGGKRVSIDTALCSDSDNFSYEDGRVKALTGALDRLGRNIDRKHIPLVLDAYHRRHIDLSDIPEIKEIPEGAQIGKFRQTEGV